MEVEAGEDDGHVVVEEGAVRHGGVVGGGDVAAVGGVGAADEGDAAFAQLVLDAGFAEDEDFVLGGWEVHDFRDVDGGGVGGGEDLVDVAGDAHCGELFKVVTAGLCRVVRDKDCLLAWCFCQP